MVGPTLAPAQAQPDDQPDTIDPPQENEPIPRPIEEPDNINSNLGQEFPELSPPNSNEGNYFEEEDEGYDWLRERVSHDEYYEPDPYYDEIQPDCSCSRDYTYDEYYPVHEELTDKEFEREWNRGNDNCDCDYDYYNDCDYLVK